MDFHDTDRRDQTTNARDGAGVTIAIMPILEIACIILFGALVWFWLEALMVREAAIRAARAACDAEGLLLLDYTVAMSAMKPVRNENGRLKLQRTYDFEYSDTGNNRLKGSVVLIGRRVMLFNVGSREPSIARTLP